MARSPFRQFSISDLKAHRENGFPIQVPDTNDGVAYHNTRAETEIDKFTNTRGYGANASIRSWRRILEAFDPAGRDGWAFDGIKLAPGAQAIVQDNWLIVGLDDSFAQANWYSGREIPKRNLYAFIGRAKRATGELEILHTCYSGQWAHSLIGFLLTNPDIWQPLGVEARPLARKY